MPRNAEQNEELRESRKKQILDAALTVYNRFGYHGVVDMEAIAKEARLAKGLLYYYFKTKKELFVELFTWMINESSALSDSLLEKTKTMNPIEQLMNYAYGIFAANETDPRTIQFNMRMPFDAYAVFSPNEWKDGAEKSDMHRRALTDIIERGMAQKLIPNANPGAAANSFWTVFVANVFVYSKLMLGEQEIGGNRIEAFRNAVQFGFQGLGIENVVWNDYLEKVVRENQASQTAGIFTQV